MSQGFIKGLLVSMIVFGLETLLLAVYLLLRRDNRLAGAKYLVRGGVTVALFTIVFLLLKPQFVLDDISLFLIFSGYTVLSVATEMVLARNFKILIAEPVTRESWQQRKTTKRQFVFIFTVAFSWILVTPAIVFTIVAPEVLPVYWWPILIISLGVVGFVCGLWYWNSNEKRFGSEAMPIQHQ